MKPIILYLKFYAPCSQNPHCVKVLSHLIKEYQRKPCDGVQDPPNPSDVAREGGKALLQVLAVPHIC